MLKIIYLLFIIFSLSILSSCYSMSYSRFLPFEINGKKYQSADEAFIDVKREYDLIMSKIESNNKTAQGRLLICLPNENRIEEKGVILAYPGRSQDGFNSNKVAVEVFKLLFDSMVKYIEKRKLFKEVSSVPLYEPSNMQFEGFDYLLWAEMKSKDNIQWYLKSSANPEEKIFIYTGTMVGFDNASSWLKNIEGAIKY